MPDLPCRTQLIAALRIGWFIKGLETVSGRRFLDDEVNMELAA